MPSSANQENQSVATFLAFRYVGAMHLLALVTLALVTSLAPLARAAPVGQWVWSLRDVAPLEEARRRIPDAVSAVQIGTLRWNGVTRAFVLQLGLSPAAVAGNATVVVRLDDALHRAWRTQAPSQIAAELNTSLARLRALMRPLATTFTWQLDYDVPVARLRPWSEVLKTLRAPDGALAGQALWVTSLISHVQAPAYEALISPVVDGHVLQIFETGAPLSSAQLKVTTRSLATTRVPFAVGVARDDVVQQEWLAALSRNPRYAGMWVFPVGKSWPAWMRSL